MKAALFAAFLICGIPGGDPAIVFDNRPEWGIPQEARDQKPLKQGGSRKFREMTQGTIKTVRIRYYNKKTWPTEQQARAYVAGFLDAKTTEACDFQIWSQVVGEPEIECLVDFTDAYRDKLRSEEKSCRTGHLLLWNTEACYRDATGRWWFVTVFDYYHKAHPDGDRKLSKGS